MSKPLHESMEDFKMFRFIWALFGQMVKLAIIAVVFGIIGWILIFFLQLMVLTAVVENKTQLGFQPSQQKYDHIQVIMTEGHPHFELYKKWMACDNDQTCSALREEMLKMRREEYNRSLIQNKP